MHKIEKKALGPVSVLVPAYNEEEAITKQINSIQNELVSNEILHEIIVVDDGSQDRTAELALQANGRVLRHFNNIGYGASLKTGILAAQYETIVIIDADGTYPADQIVNLLAKLEDADMVVGARIGKQVKIPWVRRPAKWLLGRLAARIAGQKIPDLNSGLRAFHSECVKQYFSLLPDRFSFTTTVTLALLNDNYRIVYHPINYYQRVGKSKITPWNFMEFVMLILRIAILFQPLKVFFPLACLFGFMGISKIIFDIIALFQRHTAIGVDILYQPVISTSSILLTLTGLQLLLIGMVSDAILRRFPRFHRDTNPYQEIAIPEREKDMQGGNVGTSSDHKEEVSTISRRLTKQN